MVVRVLQRGHIRKNLARRHEKVEGRLDPDVDMVRPAVLQMDVARWSAVDLVLDDGGVQHRQSNEAEADGNAHNRLQVDLPAVEERVEPSLDERPEHDATDLVHCGQKVVGRTAGLHLRSLRDEVVLHLVEADVEHDKRDAGWGQRAARVAADGAV